jgi:hypothetical protein
VPVSPYSQDFPLLAGVFGAIVYSSVVAEANVGNDVNLPGAAAVVLMVATLSVFPFCALKLLGRKKNERLLIAFSFGLILPFMIAGAASQIFLPVVLAADIITFLFFRKPWLKYSDGSIREVGIRSKNPQ